MALFSCNTKGVILGVIYKTKIDHKEEMTQLRAKANGGGKGNGHGDRNKITNHTKNSHYLFEQRVAREDCIF
jgi:hypothetical protein